MTKKDFALIANTLRYCAAHCDNDEESAIVEWVTEKFGDALAVEHPRFDSDRFLEAARL